MSEDKDIQKLKEVFVTKIDLERFATKGELDEKTTKLLEEIFATHKDLEEFREEVRKSFSNLQTSIDAYAKKADTYFQEMVILSHKVNRLEKWVKQIAEKIGMKLEY